MRAVIQKVTKAAVTIDGKIYSEIGKGLLVFVGIEDADTNEDIVWLSGKIINLRIFNDEKDVMPARPDGRSVGNISVKDTGGEILVISQFTLHASTEKGNRPSYSRASKPDVAIPVYKKFLLQLANDFGKEIKSGVFAADMKVELLNDGPVTIIMDTKKRE